MSSLVFGVLRAGADPVSPLSADDEQPAIDGIALQVARARPLAALYEPLLDHIVDSADSSAVGFRTKALRGIGLVVAQDPELFNQVRFVTASSAEWSS